MLRSKRVSTGRTGAAIGRSGVGVIRKHLTFMAVVTLGISAASGSWAQNAAPTQPPEVIRANPVLPRLSVITSPTWHRLPDRESMRASYPLLANTLDIRGRAQLSCVASRQGNLEDCEVVREAPEGLGFGRAGLGLVPRFNLEPRFVDGAAIDARVVFTVRFEPDDHPPAPRPGRPPAADRMDSARRAVSAFMRWAGPRPAMRWADGEPRPLSGRVSGADADRWAYIDQIVAAAESDSSREMEEAMVLGLARALNASQLEALAEGRRPPTLSDSQLLRHFPEVQMLDRRMIELLREQYCTRYAC